MSTELTIVNQHLRFPTVTLVEPSPSAFIHIAAEVDARPAFLPNSGKKKRAVMRCKECCHQLRSAPGVLDASVFDAILIPPGRGEFIKKRKGKVHIARFDVAILIECESLDAAELLRTHPAYTELVQLIFSAASLVHQITATNVRRIAPVDHSRGGVFLFNYFFADSVDQNLSVWNYTAGWFQAETGLDNSTVLLPIDPQINRNTASSTIAAGTRSVKYCHPSFSRDLFALMFWITLQRIILPPCRFCIAWLDKQARDRVLLKWIPFITRAESLSLGRSASLHAST